ncbi:hypothetical protein KR018_010070, partial [Drosophila ironensis]
TAMARVAPLLAMSALSLLHGLAKVFGLMATDKAGEGVRRLEQNCYWRIHGWLVMIFVAVFSPYAFLCIYHRMTFLRQNTLLLLVGFNRYIVLLFCAVVTLWIHCYKQPEIIRFLNRLLRCRRKLRRQMHTRELKDSLDCLGTRNHMIKLGLLLVAFILSAAQPFQVLKDDPEIKERKNYIYAFCLAFVYACQLTLQLSLGIYLLAMLFLGHLVHHSNLLLARILADVGCILGSCRTDCLRLQRQQLYKTQQKWLAIELWRLLHLQRQLLELHRCISRLHGVQAVCFVAFAPMECMVHLFFTYFMKYSKFILRRYGRSFSLNYYAIAFMAGLFTELLLVILPTYYSEKRFSRTREILRHGVFSFPTACSARRLNYTLDYYGLFLKNAANMFTVRACGLFKLSNVLLFSIVGAMLNYLMILIQFDKVINK